MTQENDDAPLAEWEKALLTPGYIPTPEDVAARIERDGKWGTPPKYRTCEVCGFHIIDSAITPAALLSCPVDHKQLIRALRDQIKDYVHRLNNAADEADDMADEILRARDLDMP